MSKHNIAPANPNRTVRFAAQELKKYLQCIDDTLDISIDDSKGGIELGLYEDVGLTCPALEDRNLDDAFEIRIENLAGKIAGSNPRSVLFGVYKFLEQLGVRFLRMGPDGEVIPKRNDLLKFKVELQDIAKLRHRGQCIEGSVSYENMLQSIDWSAKVGMNAYYLEFIVPLEFFDRWYGHRTNPLKCAQPRSLEEVKAYTHMLEHEIRKRGIMYHAVGHGWTLQPFGINALGWYKEKEPAPPEIAQYLAQIDGVRDYFKGVSLNTNLCYGNPKARKIMIDYMVMYTKERPNIDMLHFWLADNYNNLCECDLCTAKTPSDWYVVMMNEIDEAFTKAGLKTKVVFLLYQELLWKPLTEKINNPSRFSLLFAPVSRTYSESYNIDTTDVKLKPFELNKIKMPHNVQENIAYLKTWQDDVFKGDSFTYEYYFMWDHFLDPGYYQMAQIMSQDLKKIRKIGLNGVISDQCQRAFFPTGFPMQVLARTLWDDSTDFDVLAKSYFADAFGQDGDKVRLYLQKVSQFFDPPYLRGDKRQALEDTDNYMETVMAGAGDPKDDDAAQNLSQIPALVETFLPVIEDNLAKAKDPAVQKSWYCLNIHARIISRLAKAFEARARGYTEKAHTLWQETAQFVNENEDNVQPQFDSTEFIKMMRKRFPEK